MPVDLTTRAVRTAAAAVLACLSLGAARAADAPPDFTGVWTFYVEPGQQPFGPPGAGVTLPFRSEAKAKVDRYRSLVAPTGDNPGGHCLGSGMPDSMIGSGPYPMEWIQRPEQITVIYEAHTEVRRIYFGDRAPEPGDRFPDRNGVSTGRWDGDALVVETDSLKEQVDQTYAHSADAKIVERYSLSKAPDGRELLVAEMTLTDPAFYTAPVKATKKWARVPNGRALPYECAEEEWIVHLEKLEQDARAAGK